ncbi:MAG: respiratory nitrate reductase subunit gamma, partial [bacterium]
MARKIWLYAITPSPLKIPLTPAPTNTTGVIIRLGEEVLLFKSLFKGDRILWLFAALFHLSLCLILLSHLRFCFEGLCSFFYYYDVFFQIIGNYFGYVLVISLAYLFIRRLTMERTLYISILSDYIILILLFLIGLSGVILKYFIREDIISVKTFILSLLSLN